ncbi:hypothetical protein KM043_011465 [Ampulex compressa]|nr:hypothetical protein KM043_011465 [Ampulex compressa]
MIASEDGMKACAGNPGSPVVCEDQYHRTMLLGIASWTNFSLECGGPLTYLSVSAFRNWINKLIFTNEKAAEWETANTRYTKICKSEQYSRTINHPTNQRKNMDPLQKITNVTKKLESLTIIIITIKKENWTMWIYLTRIKNISLLPMIKPMTVMSLTL